MAMCSGKRLERYFPAQEHAQILTSLQTVVMELQWVGMNRDVGSCQNGTSYSFILGHCE